MKKEMTLAEIFEAWGKAAKEIEKTDKYEGNYGYLSLSVFREKNQTLL